MKLCEGLLRNVNVSTMGFLRGLARRLYFLGVRLDGWFASALAGDCILGLEVRDLLRRRAPGF